jgi:hypothetical protein
MTLDELEHEIRFLLHDATAILRAASDAEAEKLGVSGAVVLAVRKDKQDIWDVWDAIKIKRRKHEGSPTVAEGGGAMGLAAGAGRLVVDVDRGHPAYPDVFPVIKSRAES